MALDQQKVGQLIAEHMAAHQAHYGDDCQIGDSAASSRSSGPTAPPSASATATHAPTSPSGYYVAETTFLEAYKPEN